MQNTVYLVYYDASPDHAPSQYGEKTKQNKKKKKKKKKNENGRNV